MSLASEYIPLASSPNDSEQDLRPIEDSSTRRSSGPNDRLLFWACVGAICSSALSFIVFLGGWQLSSTSISGQPSYRQALRRPNPYVNLDKILQNGNYTFPPIINFPPLALQISTSDYQRKMSEDHRQWRSSQGTVYPDDRHVIVSPDTSTIIQFRNLDYAMERCILTVSLPRHTQPFDPETEVNDPSVVDIWALDTATEISPHIAGTWERAPQRRELLTTLTFSRTGPSNSSEFRCPSNEFTTLELACTSSMSSCNVNFWQDQKAVPRGGVYLTQYQSPVHP
ncbi:uncharacterized protein FIBRA_00319 [Fibroporia radiculosa]|uniref:Ubiquitin 3 binding protein But2 C-terminal domain-containing protein n=1 Tax=Fibroporia radiculosa TaxID=599839 RepID=J7RVD1_9APHY|nr:uncharacterized protein FIBRA_00319 [Fibroporia radiculosa]CCL98325.1 predicted protein [Fibroporia radiculosa]